MTSCEPLPNYHQGTVLYHLSTTYPRICIQYMEPQQKRQHQQGCGSATSNRQVCHWRLPAHKQSHSHATATPVANTIKQTSICLESDDVQPCFYISAEHHLNVPLFEREVIHYDSWYHTQELQCIILPTSHTPLELTTWKCGGSRHSRQLQRLVV